MIYDYEITAALPKALAFARSLTHHRADAQDLLQDALVQLLENEHRRDRRKGPLDRWLCQFIYWKWRSRNNRIRETLLDDLPPTHQARHSAA